MTSTLEAIWRDLRHATRQLRRSPVFTMTAIATLALGIGATTAVFTLVQQVMLRQLPVVRPEQLWRIGDASSCCHWNGYAPDDWNFFSWDAYKLFRANTPQFEQLAALQVGQAELAVRPVGSSAAAEARIGEYVSGNFFATFGIPAWRGRLFSDADDQIGAPPVAVMSFHTWAEQYGSDPAAIGATYVINGHPFTIVGVAAPGFFGAKSANGGMPQLWLPLGTEPLIDGPTARLENPDLGWLDLIGRVRPGTNPASIQAQLQGELHGWLASHAPDMNSRERLAQPRQTLHLTSGGAGVSLLREHYRRSLALLLVAAGFVLLLACANIANLLLARALKDRHQTALRAALGASRARLVRKALAESLTLSAIGGVVGILVAYAGAQLILRLAFSASDTPAPIDATPSAPVLLFALAVSVLTGLVFGIVPAWITSRADPIEALRGGSRSVRGERHWVQRTLVVAQAAVSLVLLSGAAMLGQSLRNMEHQNFGFPTDHRYLVSINSMLANYKEEQVMPLVRQMADRLGAVPGVRMASPALYAPLSGYDWGHDVRIAGKPEPGSNDDMSSAWTRVTPGFFQALGDRIVAGQPITIDDNANTRRVAVINEAFARKFFGRENPIGQHFGPGSAKNAGTYEIIGVAADMQYFADVRDPVRAMYFVPEAQASQFDDTDLEGREVWSHFPYSIVIWAHGEPPDLARQVKATLAEVDPNIVMYDMQSYAGVIHSDFAQENMIASLTWLFGAIGLMLSAVGLYGVTAYGVEQRTSEIGVRMALGANRASVVSMVLRGALSQVGIGLALGIPAAIGAGHLIASQLFGVKSWDGWLLGGATLVLGVATLMAAAIPARRAAAVSPMEALRAE